MSSRGGRRGRGKNSEIPLSTYNKILNPLVDDPALEPESEITLVTLANLGSVHWITGQSRPATFRSTDVLENPKFPEVIKGYKYYRVVQMDVVISVSKPKIHLLTLTSNCGGEGLPLVAGPVPEYTQIETGVQFVRSIRIRKGLSLFWNSTNGNDVNDSLNLFVQVAPVPEKDKVLDRVIFDYVVKYRIEVKNDPVTREC